MNLPPRASYRDTGMGYLILVKNANYRLTASPPARELRFLLTNPIMTGLLALALLVSPCPALPAPSAPPDEKLRALLERAVADSEGFEDRFDAEVWLMDMSARLSARLPEPQERIEILKSVHAEASRNNLQPELVLAVVDVESRFDRFAISRVGARGLMQIMPFWRDEIGRPDDNLFHVKTNLRYGCTILRYYLDAENGNVARALARYNGSLGRWEYPNRVFQALSTHWYKQ